MRHLALAAGTAFATALLLVLGRGELAAPPVGSASEAQAWLDTRGSVVAAFAILRLVALAAGGYLVLIGVLGAAAHASGRALLVGAVDRVTLPSLRAALGGAGVTAITLLAVGVAPAGADPRPPTDRLVELPADPPPTTDPASTTTTVPTTLPTTKTTTTTTTVIATTDTSAPEAPPPTMRVLPPPPPTGDAATVATASDEGPTSTSAPGAAQAAPPSGEEAASTPDGRLDQAAPSPDLDPAPTMRLLPATTAPASPDTTWTIEPGESFWSVASAHLADVWHRSPDDREVDRYWRTLMAANPDASPTGDPDLVYAGTVLALPPVEQA